MSKTLRYALEYQSARLGLALIDRLRPAAACFLAGGAAALAFVLLRRRRRLAIDNLLRAGIANDEKTARQIALGSCRHLGYVVVEALHTGRLLAGKDWERSLKVEMPEATRQLLQDAKQGVILVSGHLGNWEVGAQVLAKFKPLSGVARPLDNPRVQELLERRQMRADFETIPKHSLNPLRLVRVLRRGRILALLTDQHARNNSVQVDFFGRPAWTHTTPALLHLLTGAPILFGYVQREGVLRYRFILSEPLQYGKSGKRDEDVARITQELAKRLEAAIRLLPEQYLWMHRRWKP